MKVLNPEIRINPEVSHPCCIHTWGLFSENDVHKNEITVSWTWFTTDVKAIFHLGLTLVLLNPDIPFLCKQCRSRSVGFWRSQLIWICTVCHLECEFVSTILIKKSDWLKIGSGRGIFIYSAGQGLIEKHGATFHLSVFIQKQSEQLSTGLILSVIWPD